MDNEELKLQYSPSRWSHRFQDPEEVINKHIQVVTDASADAKSKVHVECGLQYGSGSAQLLDVFGGQTLPDEAPILVYVHGGYWQSLSREISAYPVVPQHESGVRVIIVGYDLAPSVTVGDIIKEIYDAATYIVKMAVTLGSRSVWFCGHSAGAHLLSMLLCSDWMDLLSTEKQQVVKGFILISGVYDLTPLIHTGVNVMLKMSSDDARVCSPMLLEVASSAGRQLTTLVVVGEHDSPEFQRQSKQFAEKLQHNGINVVFDVLPGLDHFNIVENLQFKEYDLTLKILELLFK